MGRVGRRVGLGGAGTGNGLTLASNGVTELPRHPLLKGASEPNAIAARRELRRQETPTCQKPPCRDSFA
jgi:hypothetical protein